MDVAAEHLPVPMFASCPRAPAIALGDAPRGRHQQAEGEVRGRIGQHARRMADGDAGAGRSRDIYIVEADREVADDAQARRGAIMRASMRSVTIVSRASASARAIEALSRGRGLVIAGHTSAVARRRECIRSDRASDKNFFAWSRFAAFGATPRGSNIRSALLYASNVNDSIVSSAIASARSSGRTVLTEIEASGFSMRSACRSRCRSRRDG